MSLTQPDGKLLDDVSAYRRLVGRLIYLTITRPDLTYVVHVLNRFTDNLVNHIWRKLTKFLGTLNKHLGKVFYCHQQVHSS